MANVRNPRAKLNLVVGVSDAAWTAAQTALLAFLDARANQEFVDDVQARAVDPAFLNDRLWNELRKQHGF